MTLPSLDTAAIGWPITRLGVSFFPVYLAADGLPAIETGEAAGLVVDELDEPSVNALRVRNPGDKPVLVVEGEHFLGGKQNRAVNVTVLVPALGDLQIPVSCLERGRWGRRRAARRDEAFAAAPVRAAKNAGVARSMRRSGSREGDQAAVWCEVDQMLSRASVQSATAAASDVRRAAHHSEPSRAATVEKLAARGPLPGQCGVVVVHGHRVTAMDLFGAPHLLAAHWGPLIRSHLLESPAGKGKPVRHAGAADRPSLRRGAGGAGAGCGPGRRASRGRRATHRARPDAEWGARARGVLRRRLGERLMTPLLYSGHDPHICSEERQVSDLDSTVETPAARGVYGERPVRVRSRRAADHHRPVRGRHRASVQAAEGGLGYDGSPVAHMWRTIFNPNRPL